MAASHASEIWRAALGDLLTVAEAAALLRRDPDGVGHDVAQGVLLGLPTVDGTTVLPAWQFVHGRPLPRLRELIEVLAPVCVTPYTVASWFVAPQPLLEGRTPAEWLAEARNPELAVEAARRQASKLAQ